MITLKQSEEGYRYNRDSFLLADFVDTKKVVRLLDVGAGVGVVSILLGGLNENIKITAMEINEQLAVCAKQNAESSQLKNYQVVIGDLRYASRMFRAGSFDAILANPPYRKKGSGRINLDPVKAVARHEIKMTLADLVTASATLLAENGSLSISMIAERKEEYLELLDSVGFSETRRKEIISFEGEPPILFLSEARKKDCATKLFIEPALVLKDSKSKSDSVEYKNIEARFLHDR